MIIRNTCRGLLLTLLLPLIGLAQTPDTNSPVQVFSQGLARLAGILDPGTNSATYTFTTTIKVVNADELANELVGKELTLAVRAPDHLKLSTEWDGQRLAVGRNGEELWVDVPGKKFGVVGKPGVPRFGTDAATADKRPLGPLAWPFPVEQIMVLPILSDIESLPNEKIDGTPCRVLKATPKPDAVALFHLVKLTVQVWLREGDFFPLKVDYQQPGGKRLVVELKNPTFHHDWPDKNWIMDSNPGEKIETVARSHLTRFVDVMIKQLTDRKLAPLGPATGAREVLAREGEGRLEKVDDTRVLVLKGTPEEMGRQHGLLLKKEIRDLVDRIVYGVGVGSSFEKGRWFFEEIAEAQRRNGPYVDGRYLREMDALASASGIEKAEMRLANFFPELFHCSGFALFGKATEGGKMYHGRILDYLRGMGLEQNAVVIVMQPEQGNAWVNVGYAGFVGSVTAMNAKHVAIGEMGGRGEGHWDGKPMSLLVREVMEKADTLEQAVEIMRKGPRTCEYYYVISDAKTQRAVGIAATPEKFETIWPGKSHPLLPHGMDDTVLMSAGDRYEELARRVKEGYGKFDSAKARDLMKRPVCMTSNIHSALFEPDSLDFWVANADSQNPAAHARFTHYNLAELLKSEAKPQ